MGAVVSSDLITQALILILFGAIGIMAWITYRFRDFKMGVTALVALLHDVLVVVGLFAIFGTFLGLQIDGLFVTAMLTIIGFSVHDTIVVFDRVRENRSRHAGEPFDRIVNHSILQTFGRSITTSLTVVITLLACCCSRATRSGPSSWRCSWGSSRARTPRSSTRARSSWCGTTGMIGSGRARSRLARAAAPPRDPGARSRHRCPVRPPAPAARPRRARIP